MTAPDAAPERATSAVTMYSTQWCGYCHRLKSQLDREGIAYDVVDIEQVPDAAFVVEQVNRRQPDRPDAGVRRRLGADQPVGRRRQGEARHPRLSSTSDVRA